jgi:putative membrane protein
MYNDTKFIKKIVGSFVAIAGTGTLIIAPEIVQANIPSYVANSSNQSIFAQNTPARTSPSNGSSTSDDSQTALNQQFVTNAAQSDLTEIQTSQLAVERSKTPAVREFAQRMIKDHTQSSQQLTQIAQQKGFTLPKSVGEQNEALLTKLSKLQGTEFDRAYMNGQVQAHTKAVNLYQQYLQEGQDPQLKAFASKFEPIIANHLNMAKKMVQG